MNKDQDPDELDDAPPPPPENDTQVIGEPFVLDQATTELAAAAEPEQQTATGKRHLTRANKAVIGVAAGVLVVAGAYVGAAWYLQDKVPNNTNVDGVTIGGLSTQAAINRVNEHYAAVVGTPITVTLGERTTEVDPSDMGLQVDAAATIGQATGFSLNPTRLWQHITGFGALEPVSVLDDERAQAEVTAVADNLNVAPVDGAITLVDGAAEVSDAVLGESVDVPAAVEQIRLHWLEGTAIELPATETEPSITQAEVDQTMSTVVEPLLSGPVTVEAGDVSQELTVDQLAAAATIQATDGALQLSLDADALLADLVAANDAFASDGKDAQIIISNGAPTIIPSEAGHGIAADDLATAVQSAAVGTDRVAHVEFTEAEADFTTEDAQALGVTEVVSEFSTPLTSDSVRTTNLVVGTGYITNTLVKPGETFSLENALGPITAARGFVSSGVVENGFATTALGGGLSQLSTTSYNAAFFAGMDLVEHTPHTRYFSRYPEGRESTLWEGSIDMKFKNSTPYGVLVQAWTESGRVWVRFWSTKYFEVDTTTSSRYNITSPTTVYNSAADCTPESGGQNGFTVDVTRTRLLNGSVYSNESWTVTYTPWNTVVCGSAPTS